MQLVDDGGCRAGVIGVALEQIRGVQQLAQVKLPVEERVLELQPVAPFGGIKELLVARHGDAACQRLHKCVVL